jgi:hypothetical protein
MIDPLNEPEPPNPWHRILGLTLSDYFYGTDFKVEMEKDLSLKRQLLDILVIEQSPNAVIENPAAGLHDMARFNLASYKSFQESMNDWALNELIASYVGYRKLVRRPNKTMFPESCFKLYGLCTLFPKKLMKGRATREIEEGIYDILWGSFQVRLIVLSEVPKSKKNAVWNLFSGIPEKVGYGKENYSWQRPDLSTVINKLYSYYQLEGITMAYTVEDYVRETREEALSSLTPKQRVDGLSPSELLSALTPDERLSTLTPDERLSALMSQEFLSDLTPAQLKALRDSGLLKDD